MPVCGLRLHWGLNPDPGLDQCHAVGYQQTHAGSLKRFELFSAGRHSRKTDKPKTQEVTHKHVSFRLDLLLVILRLSDKH